MWMFLLANNGDILGNKRAILARMGIEGDF